MSSRLTPLHSSSSSSSYLPKEICGIIFETANNVTDEWNLIAKTLEPAHACVDDHSAALDQVEWYLSRNGRRDWLPEPWVIQSSLLPHFLRFCAVPHQLGIVKRIVRSPLLKKALAPHIPACVYEACLQYNEEAARFLSDAYAIPSKSVSERAAFYGNYIANHAVADEFTTNLVQYLGVDRAVMEALVLTYMNDYREYHAMSALLLFFRGDRKQCTTFLGHLLRKYATYASSAVAHMLLLRFTGDIAPEAIVQVCVHLAEIGDAGLIEEILGFMDVAAKHPLTTMDMKPYDLIEQIARELALCGQVSGMEALGKALKHCCFGLTRNQRVSIWRAVYTDLVSVNADMTRTCHVAEMLASEPNVNDDDDHAAASSMEEK
jgi:hypothetical protein